MPKWNFFPDEIPIKLVMFCYHLHVVLRLLSLDSDIGADKSAAINWDMVDEEASVFFKVSSIVSRGAVSELCKKF